MGARPLSALVLALAATAACSDGDASEDAGAADAGSDAGPALDARTPDAGAFVPRVPEETADDEALARLADLPSLPVFGADLYRMQTSYDRDDGAPAPLPILENGNRDLDNFVCRSAGARPADSAVVPYRFDEPECDDADGFVLARFEGSGVMTRVWMTSSGLLGGEVLRVYVDGATDPAIEVRLRDAWTGAAGEIFAPPFGAGSESHLAWHYPVVFSSKLVVAIDLLEPLNAYYHQVSAVLDATPRSRVAPPSASPMRERARRALVDMPDRGAELSSSGPTVVDAGMSLGLADVDGPATIRAFVLTVPTAALAALADVTVEVVFDGATDPAMSLPLDELFAAGLAPPEVPSAILSASRAGDDTVLALALPMPFATHASVAVTNAGATSLPLALALFGVSGVPDAPFGRLHATRSATGPGDADRHAIVSATGRGRLAGVCFMLEGHALERLGALFSSPLNFLEGDELVRIDGEPAILGTGTEDYLESAFYFREGPFATPFAQAWDVTTDSSAMPARGRVSSCRWHLGPDAIDFATELAMDLEIGPNAPELRDRYRTVAFTYQ
jgi:hypothetical protein